MQLKGFSYMPTHSQEGWIAEWLFGYIAGVKYLTNKKLLWFIVSFSRNSKIERERFLVFI